MEPFPFLIIILGLGAAAFGVGVWALSGVAGRAKAKPPAKPNNRPPPIIALRYGERDLSGPSSSVSVSPDVADRLASRAG